MRYMSCGAQENKITDSSHNLHVCGVCVCECVWASLAFHSAQLWGQQLAGNAVGTPRWAKKCETLIRYKTERCHTNTHQHTQQAISLSSSWSVAGGLIRPVSGLMQIIRLSFLSGRGNLIMHVYTQVQNSNNKQSNKAWHEMCIKEPRYKTRLSTSLLPLSTSSLI